MDVSASTSKSQTWSAAVAVALACLLIGGIAPRPGLALGRAGEIDVTADSAAGTVSFENPTPITITPGSPATPYPSTIVYDWCPGTITDVDVLLNDLSHTFPDDIDIVLQGPGGQSTKIMSDVGGSTDVNLVSVTFDDEAATGAPEVGPIVDGARYRPTNSGNAVDAMPPPSPDPTEASLSVFDGTNPVGNWNLFVADLGPLDGGTIGSGWDLLLTVTSQVSGSRVCIPDVGLGEPYPSAQTISGRTSPIKDLNVSLTDLNKTVPDDLDVLLVGPGGQSAMLMSDAGGSGDTGVDLVFDDEAAASLPDQAQITSGTFKPSNFETLESLPGPAPITQGTSLGVFDGTDPNGVWRLFVIDDLGPIEGILGGWSLITTPQAPVAVKGKRVKEGKAVFFTLVRTQNLDLWETVSFGTKNGSAKKGKDYRGKSGSLTFAPGESSKQVKVRTKNDSEDEDNERFFLRVNAGGVISRGAARIKDND